MTLFNHEIEYLPVYRYDGLDELYKSMDIRAAIVSYDNLLGVRHSYRLDAPANMWDSLKVGGMASTGGILTIGIVSKVRHGDCSVRSTALGESRHMVIPATERLQVGQQVIIFDMMEHAPEHLDEFTTVVTPRLDIAENLSVHSIKVMVWNQGDHIGSVHIDPFDNTLNHDRLELWPRDREWKHAHFCDKHL